MKKIPLLLLVVSVLLAVGIAQVDWVADGQTTTADQIYGWVYYQGQVIGGATVFLKAGEGYTGGDYDRYYITDRDGRYKFNALLEGSWYTVWAVKNNIGKTSTRHDVKYTGSATRQDLYLTNAFRSKIYGYVWRQGQKFQGAVMTAWAIRTLDQYRKDWPTQYSDANGYYEHSWDTNGFYIFASPSVWDDATFYSRCSLARTLAPPPPDQTKESKDPYPSSGSKFSWHTSPPGWWWECHFILP